MNRFDAMVVQNKQRLANRANNRRNRGGGGGGGGCGGGCLPGPDAGAAMAMMVAGSAPMLSALRDTGSDCPKAFFPTILADQCLDVRYKAAPNFDVPPWVLAEFMAVMERASAADPLTGSDSIDGAGASSVVITPDAGESRRVGAYIVELSSGTTTGPATTKFVIDTKFEDGSACRIGPFLIQTRGGVRGRCVVFPYRQAASGSVVIYPMLTQLSGGIGAGPDFLGATVSAPKDAFGANIPPALVLLGSPSSSATLTGTGGTENADVTLSTLSANDSIFSEVQRFLMACARGARPQKGQGA